MATRALLTDPLQGFPGTATPLADAAAAGELNWLVAADCTMVRVHQHDATACPAEAARQDRRHPLRDGYVAVCRHSP